MMTTNTDFDAPMSHQKLRRHYRFEQNIRHIRALSHNFREPRWSVCIYGCIIKAVENLCLWRTLLVHSFIAGKRETMLICKLLYDIVYD